MQPFRRREVPGRAGTPARRRGTSAWTTKPANSGVQLRTSIDRPGTGTPESSPREHVPAGQFHADVLDAAGALGGVGVKMVGGLSPGR